MKKYFIAAIVFFETSCALIARVAFWPVETRDLRNCVEPWFSFLRMHSFAASFAADFSNYNPPYLYLLFAASRVAWMPSGFLAAKLLSTFFDLMLAVIAFALMRRCGRSSHVAILCAVTVPLIPTVILNSAGWGQCDAIYTSFVLLSVLCAVCDLPFGIAACFGIALAFKLQAIFLSPFLLLLWLTGRIRFRYVLIVPLTFFVLLLPAWLAGRGWGDLLFIYPRQTGQYEFSTMGAPTVWAALPTGVVYDWMLLSAVFAAVLAATIWISKRRPPKDNVEILFSALLSLLAAPFFLPRMHERYFYAAEVLAVIFAFIRPKHLVLPLALQLAIVPGYLAYIRSPLTGPTIKTPSIICVLLMSAAVLYCCAAYVRSTRRQ